LLYRYLLFSFVIGSSAILTAAELQLSNGDRITGELIRREDGKIHFRSPILGDLIIAETDAVVIEMPDTPVESLAGLPPMIEQVHLRDAESLRPPPKPKTTPWRGRFEFGFQNQAGRHDSLNYSMRTELERKSQLNHYRLSARYLYGESRQVVSSDRRDASFRWRHEISERFFSQTVTSYSSDAVTNIDLNAEQNAGFGYEVFESPKQTGSVGAGLTVQFRESDGSEPGTTYLGEFFQDYSFKLNGRLTLMQNLNVLFSPDQRARTLVNAATSSLYRDEAENYKVRFNSTLQGKLSERISINLRYEYEYDNAIYDAENRADRRVTSSLGYSF
jgi:putative salt-induced outer membrane protein YdiY